MAVTAQEGEAFLKSQGMEVTDDDVKTRGQKEKLDEITSETPANDEPPKPAVARQGTMAVTAQEGKELLGDEELEKTRGQTEALKEAVATSPEKPHIPRDNTMVTTAQEGQQLLGGQELEKTRQQTAEAEAQKSPPAKVKRTTTIAQTTTEASSYILGEEARAKTRAQTRKLSESEEKKPAVKRTSTMAQTAKEGEEFLAREAKRTKTDEEAAEGEKDPEVAAEA